jgi:acyl-CoA reductase-like NAD-dependent aldehyde dehydrogenase
LRRRSPSPVLNLATEDTIAEVPVADQATLDRAVAVARTAFAGWAATSFEKRQRVVAEMGDLLEAHAKEFMALLTVFAVLP